LLDFSTEVLIPQQFIKTFISKILLFLSYLKEFSYDFTLISQPIIKYSGTTTPFLPIFKIGLDITRRIDKRNKTSINFLRDSTLISIDFLYKNSTICLKK